MLLFLYWVVEDHDILFKLSETFHLVGLAILLFKLHQKKSAAGASLGRGSVRALACLGRVACAPCAWACARLAC